MPLLSPAMQSKQTARGKVITQFVTWGPTDADGVVFDFTAQGNAMLLREPVCVFVDNTRGTAELAITVEGYAYQLIIQPGMIVSLPLFSVALPRVTVTPNAGMSGSTSFVFCDFMLPNFAFEATGVSQATTDTILEEVVSGGAGSQALRVTDAEAISQLGVMGQTSSKILSALNSGVSVTEKNSAAILAAIQSSGEKVARKYWTFSYGEQSMDEVLSSVPCTLFSISILNADNGVKNCFIADGNSAGMTDPSTVRDCMALPSTTTGTSVRRVYENGIPMQNGIVMQIGGDPTFGSPRVTSGAFVVIELTLT